MILIHKILKNNKQFQIQYDIISQFCCFSISPLNTETIFQTSTGVVKGTLPDYTDTVKAVPADQDTTGRSSRLESDRPAVTITVNFVHPSSNKCIHPYQDRALTPREGARLQGFEDSFRFKGNRSQMVKQIGNAVPPLLGQVIAEALLRHF